MGFSAFVDGERVVAPLASEEEWAAIKRLSKARKVLMADTKLPAQAKTLRWKTHITRFFAHFPGEAPEGYASLESPQHAAMKLAIFLRLREVGIPAEIEWGMDNWQADVFVPESVFGKPLAIEVQLSKQSAEETYQRTSKRTASGVSTLWLFGPRAMQGHLGNDLLSENPVFFVDTLEKATEAAEAVCTGKAVLDDLSRFAETPARPLAVQVNCRCGLSWLRPLGVILLPNRVRGDLEPVFVSCSFTSARQDGKTLSYNDAVNYLRRYLPVLRKAGEHYDLPLGNYQYCERFRCNGAMAFKQDFTCPRCQRSIYTYGTLSPAFFPKGIDVKRCPLPIFGRVDARPVLKVSPMWHLQSIEPVIEIVATREEWRVEFIEKVKAMTLILHARGNMAP